MRRESLQHPIFKREPVTEWEAWARLIARAAYADTHHRVGGAVVPVKRGSFYTTLRELRAEFMWYSDKRVRGFLQRLEAAGMIVLTVAGNGRSTGARKTHISICNYEVYQHAGRIQDAGETQDGRKADALKNKGTRLQEGGGGSAHAPAREADLDDEAPFGAPDRTQQDPEVLRRASIRDQVLDEASIDISKARNPARWLGSESLQTIEQWESLGLTDDEIVETVREVMLGKTDGPPKTLSYFTEAMQRRAGRKQAPPLTPIQGGRHEGQSPRQRRAEDELRRDLDFADDLDRQRGRG